VPHADVRGDAPGIEAALAVLGPHVASGRLPTAALEVGDSRQSRACAVLGTAADAIYDLASLTKVLATGLLALDLFGERQIDLDTPVARLTPLWVGADRHAVTVRDLLAHTSGLPAHQPLYAEACGPAEVLARSATAPLAYRPRTRSVYSDLGFIVLADALARALDEDWASAVRARLATLSADPPQYAIPAGRLAVGTGRSAWRGQVPLGEVHDDNAAALGGVAGHAGLFGSVQGVGDVARAVLHSLRGEGHLPFAQQWAVRSFARRSSVPGSSRALAWDTALPTSSSGAFLSPRAIGHTGFTGTSIWIDPELNLYVVLLTNRVAGSASADDMGAIRRAVHDHIGAAWRAREAF